jgi:D-alanyl-D-alanine carboxypeptidase
MASSRVGPGPLQGGARGPHRRRRRRLLLVRIAVLVAIAALGAVLLTAGGQDARRRVRAHAAPGSSADAQRSPAVTPEPRKHEDAYATVAAPPGQQVNPRFVKPPRGGMLFDLRSGRVLWAWRPTQTRSIASLTKMMTALLVAEREPPDARPLVTREALRYQGSGVGLLPRGKRVGLLPLLYGLMLPSGNDAARVLAQDVGHGSIPAFVAAMNEKAHQLGLTCTHFAGPDGYDDANRSCPRDLARLARAVMAKPLLRRVVGTPFVEFPFPIKGRKLYLAGHNPLYRLRYRGWRGIKTGYSPAAGECFVGVARHGATWLGVVLLDSPNAGMQAVKLLDRGFAAERRRAFAPPG